MSATPPEELIRRLDRFAKLGVAIESTEFDINIGNANDPEQRDFQRDYARDFLTALFSHQAVIGINHWSSIRGTAHSKTGTLFDEEGNPLPTGEAWVKLVKGDWWTTADSLTDPQGNATLRGFKGNYKITVSHKGRTSQATATISDTPNTLTIVWK